VFFLKYVETTSFLIFTRLYYGWRWAKWNRNVINFYITFYE